MSEVQVKLTGWQAVVGMLVIIAILGVRLATFSDQTDDPDLMRKLEFEMMTEYFPDDVKRLGAVLKTGDWDEITRTAKSVTSSKLTIETVKTSYPPFNFDATKKVIVKVAYSLDDKFGNRSKGTKYYRFIHKSLGSVWEYEGESNAVSYYLNFM